MKALKTRNVIIMFLCATIICLGIGFSYLSIELNKKNANSTSFDVSFTNVELVTPIKGGKIAPVALSSITNSNKTVNFNITMYAPRDEITYKVTIKNTGTMKAEIINLIEVPDYLNDTSLSKSIYPLKITHNDIVGKVLEPDEEITLNISVIFNHKAEALTKTINYGISLLTKSSAE